MQEIALVAPNMLPAEARNYLAKYLFTGEDVFRKVATLSGGERGRLALAKLSLSDANLLLLDEPTNHLDLPTQEVLQSILSSYRGTIILVSHDRYLIDALASQIWDVDPQAETLHVFKGSYTEFKAEKAAKTAQILSGLKEELSSHKSSRTVKTSTQALSRNQERRIRSRMSRLESSIDALELDLKHISAQLEDPPDDPGKVQQLGQTYVEIQSQIDKLLSEWESLGLQCR